MIAWKLREEKEGKKGESDDRGIFGLIRSSSK